MKITEENIVTYTEEKLVEIRCDLCNSIATNGDWNKSNWGVEEIEISYRGGNAYPECGDGVSYSIDLCPKCFKEKLVPWLNEQGANINAIKWEY